MEGRKGRDKEEGREGEKKKERRKKGKEPSEASRAEGSRQTALLQTVRGRTLRRNLRFTYKTWEIHLLGVNNLTFQKSCFPSPPALSMEFSLHATWVFICCFFFTFFVIPTTTTYGVNKEKLSFHIASTFFLLSFLCLKWISSSVHKCMDRKCSKKTEIWETVCDLKRTDTLYRWGNCIHWN